VVGRSSLSLVGHLGGELDLVVGQLEGFLGSLGMTTQIELVRALRGLEPIVRLRHEILRCTEVRVTATDVGGGILDYVAANPKGSFATIHKRYRKDLDELLP